MSMATKLSFGLARRFRLASGRVVRMVIDFESHADGDDRAEEKFVEQWASAPSRGARFRLIQKWNEQQRRAKYRRVASSFDLPNLRIVDQHISGLRRGGNGY